MLDENLYTLLKSFKIKCEITRLSNQLPSSNYPKTSNSWQLLIKQGLKVVFVALFLESMALNTLNG